MTGLEPDELRHRLFEAVEPLKISPDAYERIRAGVIRRRRMRVPAMAFGGLALAGLIGVAYVVSEPRTSSTLVEPATPLFTQTVGVTTARTPTSSSVHGGPAGGPGHPPATQASSPSPSPITETSPVPSPSATASQPSVTPSNFNSPPRPTPVSVPAKKGDIDGDGVDDTPHLSGNTLVVTLSQLGSATVTLSEVVSPLTFSIMDINSDGYGELIVQVGGGAGTRTFTVIELTPAGQLRQLSGSPLPLSAGLAGTHGDGFRCDPGTAGTLVVAAGDSTGDRTYSVTYTTWRLTGEGFRMVGPSTSSTVDLNTAPSPFTAGCGIG